MEPEPAEEHMEEMAERDAPRDDGEMEEAEPPVVGMMQEDEDDASYVHLQESATRHTKRGKDRGDAGQRANKQVSTILLVVEQELGAVDAEDGDFHQFAQTGEKAIAHAIDIWNKSGQLPQPSPEAKAEGEVWDAEICAREVCRRIKDEIDKGTEDIHTLVPRFIKEEGGKVMKKRDVKRKKKRGKPRKGRPRERWDID